MRPGYSHLRENVLYFKGALAKDNGMKNHKQYPFMIAVLAVLLLCLGAPAMADGVAADGFYAVYAAASGPLDLFSYQRGFVRDGYHFEYYDTGNVKHIAFYRNGRPDGLEIGYYENGLVFFRENFKNGKRDGKSLHYYPDGLLKLSVQYYNGVPDGEARFYTQSGYLEKINVYDDGRITRLTRYDRNGDLIEEKYFN